MPELPEVESVARSLRPHLLGSRIGAVEVSGLPLRRPVDKRGLDRACLRQRIEGVERVGKYLTLSLSNGAALVVHLGMSGRLTVEEAAEPRARHTHVVLRLDSGRELRFVDPRRFGLWSVHARGASRDELAQLGPDPLSPAFDEAYLAGVLAGSRRSVKELLLDQSKVAGLGNIYVCEALFLAGVAATRRADRVRRVAPLHAAIRAVLEQGIRNRGTSISDYVDADGQAGSNQSALAVYGREGEPCRACGRPIRRKVQGGRSTFFCGRCQR